MKRLQLFEFEDLPWFPRGFRICMTRYLDTIHRLTGSSKDIASKLHEGIKKSAQYHILDLCSGSGGPMLDVVKVLKEQYELTGLRLTLSDKYPDIQAAEYIKQLDDPALDYLTTPVDAGQSELPESGWRTLICGLHHMKPPAALTILKNACRDRQPIFVYEISDNSFPKWVWWMVIPINIMAAFLITLWVRPLNWKQILFTYFIPVLPLVIAWDGAVSNARTYTLEDLDALMGGISWHRYSWEKGTLKGKAGRKIYLMGLPDDGPG